MALFLTILKWIGIVLLAVLLFVVIILLLVLFVPVKYQAAARINDPETHESFPIEVLRSGSDIKAEISWFMGAIKVIVAYPGATLMEIRVFGKKFSRKKPAEEAPPQEEPAQEQTEEEEETAGIFDRIEKLCMKADYFWRVLTGSCGRRALRKIEKRLYAITVRSLPSKWEVGGTLGLSDPCMNGRVRQVCAVLMPFLEEHLNLATQWEMYRCDLKAEMAGRIFLAVPVKEAVPLVFDKDCRKLYKKLKRARSKFR